MLASKIACPNCRTGFQTSSALKAGQKLKCPKCGAYFSVPAQSSMLAGIQPSPPRSSNVETRRDMNLHQPRTRSDMSLSSDHGSRTPVPGQKRGKTGLIVLILAVALVLLIGIPVAVLGLTGFGRSSSSNSGTPTPESSTWRKDGENLEVDTADGPMSRKVKVSNNEMTWTDEKGNVLTFKRKSN